jgi:MinD-like ATPase involved in chromosome partitioning or flagellar assembly
MFAGERRGAGTTTLAAYAARRMAQLGLSVALVDTDFAKPALARTLGVAVEYGWDDALEANADFTAAMIASLDDGVTILPLRHATFGLTAARATRVAADLAVLRKHFALVILDGGPLAEVAEPWLALAPEETVDCGIVVRDVRIDAARRGPSRPHAPRSAALPAIGVVENFVSQPPS